jgi:5-methylcytosine-specific restriction endonuclease McrA
MSLCIMLRCDCRPGFVYKTEGSFKTHLKSQRHLNWLGDQELRDCKIRLKKLENENQRLLRVIDALTLSKPRTRGETRSVSMATKKQVAASQNWACGRCHNLVDEKYEVDHIIPLFKGGGNDCQNLMALCKPCHDEKTGRERATPKITTYF